MASTFHVDFTSGSDSNDGTTRAKAKLTYAAALALLTANSGDTLQVWGVFRPPITGSSAWNSATFPSHNVSGVRVHFNGVTIRGDADPLFASWSNSGVNSSVAALPGSGIGDVTGASGAYIDGVVYDYDNSFTTSNCQDGQTRPHGHLKWVADAATVDATTNSWFIDYTATPPNLYINVVGRAPSGKVAVVRGRHQGANGTTPYVAGGGGAADYNGFTVTGCSNVYLDGTCNICNVSPFSNGGGYGVQVQNNSNIVWDVSGRLDNCGYHVAGCSGNGASTNIVFKNILCFDLGGPTGASSIATGTTVVAHGTSVTGVRFENCGIYAGTHLDPAGNKVLTVGTIQAAYWHTTAAAAINDLEFSNCRFFINDITDHASAGNPAVVFLDSANNVDYSGGTYDAGARPIRFRDCYFGNGTAMTIRSSWAFIRCYIDLTQCGPSNASGTQGGAIRLAKDNGIKNLPIFESCVILTNMDPGSGFTGNAVQAFTGTFASGDGIVFKNCTLLDMGDPNATVGTQIFSYNSKTNWTIYAEGCILGYYQKKNTQTSFCGGDGTIDNTFHLFTNNVYSRIKVGGWSANASYDTAAEWLSSIDTGAVHVTTTTFGGLTTGTGQITTASPAYVRVFTPNHAVLGINKGGRYIGNYGAWQITPRGRTIRNIRNVRSVRG